MAWSRPDLYGWGLRLAAAFVVCLLPSGVAVHPSSSAGWLRIAVHGLVVALALNVGGIGLAMLAFLHRYRIAVSAKRVGWWRESERKRRDEARARQVSEPFPLHPQRTTSFTDSPGRGGIDVERVLGLIDGGDLCGTAFLILIFAGIGSKMVEGHAGAQRAGRRLSAAAFIAYVVSAALRFDPPDAGALAAIALRGLLAAGMTLGVAWIALAVIAFAYDRVIARPIEAARNWARAARLRRARDPEPSRPIEPALPPRSRLRPSRTPLTRRSRSTKSPAPLSAPPNWMKRSSNRPSCTRGRSISAASTG
jgi:hypothetical protein